MKFTKTLFTFLALLVFINCSKSSSEEVDENNSNETFSDFETIDYSSKQYAPGIFLIRRYMNDKTKTTLFVYGRFNENTSTEIESISQIVYEDETQNLIFSFNNEKQLVNSYSQDINTGLVSNELLYVSKNNKFYVGDNNGQTTEILNQDINQSISFNGNDQITLKINQLFEINNVYFNYFLKQGVSSTKLSSATVTQRTSVLGFDKIANILISIQNAGIKKITKNTEIESNNSDELLENISEWCDSWFSSKLSRVSKINSDYSSYSCSEEPEVIKKRKISSTIDLTLCEGDKICYTDCNGDVNGIAYWDDCGECVEGNTNKQPCTIDCNGDANGTAYLSDCDICIGGNTGLNENTACASSNIELFVGTWNCTSYSDHGNVVQVGELDQDGYIAECDVYNYQYKLNSSSLKITTDNVTFSVNETSYDFYGAYSETEGKYDCSSIKITPDNTGFSVINNYSYNSNNNSISVNTIIYEEPYTYILTLINENKMILSIGSFKYYFEKQ